MAFIPVTNTAEITMEWQLRDSDIAQNVWGVKNTAAWDASSLTTMANAFLTWWHTTFGSDSYQSHQGPGTIMIDCIARDLTTQTSPVITVTNAHTPDNGTDSSGDLQNGLTKAFTARSGLSGRSQRGRTFVVGLASNTIDTGDNNLINTGTADSFVLILNGLIAAVPAAISTCSLVVISRFHNGAPRSSGVTTPILSYGYKDRYYDFQRRRAPGHSRHH